MKLTPHQVTFVYALVSDGDSYRSISRFTKHSRTTITRYLKPQVMAEAYMELHEDLYYTNNNLTIEKREKSLWKNLAIIGAIGHAITILTYFFL